MIASPSVRPPRVRQGGVRGGALPLLGGLLVLYLLGPVVALLVRLASSTGSGLPTAGLASALGISVLTASISTVIIAVLGIPLAWCLAQGQSRVWDVVGVAVQLPLALPPLMSGILLIEVVGPYTAIGRLFDGRLSDSTAGIVLAQTFVAAPFLVVAARSAFATVDRGLLDLAATLGHRRWSRFLRVSLPLAAPGIAGGLLLAWLRAFGEFGATVILAYHPYSLPVFTFVQFSSTGLPSALPPTAAAIAAALVVLALVRWSPRRSLRTWRARLPPGEPPGSASRPPAAIHAAGQAATGAVEAPGDDSRTPATLDFDLRAQLGSFELELARTASAPHLALLGASGAGKSLTLRCLAGLHGSAVGRVRLGERNIGALAPEDRRIGWVPQDAGLFPHLTVWRQLTFGVGTDPALADHWLDRLGLSTLRNRRPSELSGGQRQRVALARALARSPDLILLDEPFSSLDKPVRDELRRELRRLQHEVGVATVLVTHDPQEAAMLADEVIVLDNGRQLQAGTRAAVFARPASARVARLLGIENLHTGTLASPQRLLSNHTELAITDTGLPVGTRVAWCIRAEHVILDPAQTTDATPEALGGPPANLSDSSPASVSHPAVTREAFDLGAWREVTVCLDDGLELTARTINAAQLAPGQPCRATIPARAIILWADAPAATNARDATSPER